MHRPKRFDWDPFFGYRKRSASRAVLIVLLLVGFSSALGQELDWAIRAGGPGFDAGLGVAVDAAGNSYVTGIFFGTVTFGPGEDHETSLSSAAGFGDLFVAKYDRHGALVWVSQAGGPDLIESAGIAVDDDGNSYVTGRFRRTITFGLGEDRETLLTSAGDVDLFVAKYDRHGALVWVSQAGGADSVEGLSIAVDEEGNSYVTGGFLGTATFALGEGHETPLTSAGDADLFLAKYDRHGALVWVTQASGPELNVGTGIAVDSAGNNYATGFFSGTATFGAGGAHEIQLTSAGPSDIFVAKYDRHGTLVWVTQAGGQNVDSGAGIAVDGAGNSYVTGRFTRPATFGAGEANETRLTVADVDTPFDNLFVAKYNRHGTLVWVTQAGGIGLGRGNNIAVDGLGNSYVTGFFSGMATFSPGEPNETSLIGVGDVDLFLAKYNRHGALVWITQAGEAGQVFVAGVAVDGAGNSSVTGRFTNAAIFGPGEANETRLTSAGPADFFLAKYRGDRMTTRLLRFCNIVTSLWRALSPPMTIASGHCLKLEAVRNISTIFQALDLPASGREPVVKLRER